MVDPRGVQTSGCDTARNKLHPLTVRPISRPIYGKYWFKLKSHKTGYRHLLNWLENKYGKEMVFNPQPSTDIPVMQWRGGQRLSAYFDDESAFYLCAERNRKHLELAELPYNQKQVDLWCEDSSLTLMNNLWKGQYRYRVEFTFGGYKKSGPMDHIIPALKDAGCIQSVDYDYTKGWNSDILFIKDRSTATLVKLLNQPGVRYFAKALTMSEVEN